MHYWPHPVLVNSTTISDITGLQLPQLPLATQLMASWWTIPPRRSHGRRHPPNPTMWMAQSAYQGQPETLCPTNPDCLESVAQRLSRESQSLTCEYFFPSPFVHDRLIFWLSFPQGQHMNMPKIWVFSLSFEFCPWVLRFSWALIIFLRNYSWVLSFFM